MVKDEAVLEVFDGNGLQLFRFNRLAADFPEVLGQNCRNSSIAKMKRRKMAIACLRGLANPKGLRSAYSQGPASRVSTGPRAAERMLLPSSPGPKRPGCRRLSRIMSSASTMDSRGSLRLDHQSTRGQGARHPAKRGGGCRSPANRKAAYDGLTSALARLNGGPDPRDLGLSTRSTAAPLVAKIMKDGAGRPLQRMTPEDINMSLSDRQAIIMWMSESLDVDDAVVFTAIAIADRYGAKLASQTRYYSSRATLLLSGAELQQVMVAALCIALKTADTFDGKDTLEKGVAVRDFLAHLSGYMLPPEKIYTAEATILNVLNFDVYNQTAEYVVRTAFSAYCPTPTAEALPREYWLAQYLLEIVALSIPLSVINSEASLAAVCIACEACGAHSPVATPDNFASLRAQIMGVWRGRWEDLGYALAESIDKKYASPKRRCVSLISLDYYFEEANYHCY
ncbi:hypothetical protein FOL47_007570 [Perkinsus chesapeaki]|uniref:Cyclin N-terminal domain-containing protein n=1 Tax=Perkinsus chesapeaki TaxID=330153 RepID=A0A7J6LJN7_PERCH|nr:hypothetical protein FOL47_007570 [Perkinsus chesapeaki]